MQPIAGIVQAGATGNAISIMGPTLVAVANYYQGRSLLINPGSVSMILRTGSGNYQTGPCDSHSVSGSGASAIHTFNFNEAQAFVPSAGDVAFVGGF